MCRIRKTKGKSEIQRTNREWMKNMRGCRVPRESVSEYLNLILAQTYYKRKTRTNLLYEERISCGACSLLCDRILYGSGCRISGRFGEEDWRHYYFSIGYTDRWTKILHHGVYRTGTGNELFPQGLPICISACLGVVPLTISNWNSPHQPELLTVIMMITMNNRFQMQLSLLRLIQEQYYQVDFGNSKSKEKL